MHIHDTTQFCVSTSVCLFICLFLVILCIVFCNSVFVNFFVPILATSLEEYWYLLFLVAHHCASYCFTVIHFILYSPQLANKLTLTFFVQWATSHFLSMGYFPFCSTDIKLDLLTAFDGFFSMFYIVLTCKLL